MMHAIAEDLSSSQDNLTLSKLVQDFDVENIAINLQHDKAIYEELLCSQGSRYCPPPTYPPARPGNGNTPPA